MVHTHHSLSYLAGHDKSWVTFIVTNYISTFLPFIFPPSSLLPASPWPLCSPCVTRKYFTRSTLTNWSACLHFFSSSHYLCTLYLNKQIYISSLLNISSFMYYALTTRFLWIVAIWWPFPTLYIHRFSSFTFSSHSLMMLLWQISCLLLLRVSNLKCIPWHFPPSIYIFCFYLTISFILWHPLSLFISLSPWIFFSEAHLFLSSFSMSLSFFLYLSFPPSLSR